MEINDYFPSTRETKSCVTIMPKKTQSDLYFQSNDEDEEENNRKSKMNVNPQQMFLIFLSPPLNLFRGCS